MVFWGVYMLMSRRLERIKMDREKILRVDLISLRDVAAAEALLDFYFALHRTF